MRFLKIFLLIFVCYSSVLAADDNTVLPDADTLIDRQQKIRFACAKNKDGFIEKISELHLPSITVPTLATIPPVAALGRVIPQSYFTTSDIRIVDYCIQRAIHHGLQPDHGGGDPQYATVRKGAPNSVIIRCNLRDSGDLLPYFPAIGGFGMNVIPDATHPVGGLTDWIQVVIQKKSAGWELASAYPVHYN
jgi:hypothetical protein